MRLLGILVVLVVLLLVGGGLTSMLVADGGGSLVPILQQVGSPDASVTTVLPWKAEQFFLLVGLILFNLVGIAATIAIVLWLIDRGIKKSKAEAALESKAVASRAENA